MSQKYKLQVRVNTEKPLHIAEKEEQQEHQQLLFLTAAAAAASHVAGGVVPTLPSTNLPTDSEKRFLLLADGSLTIGDLQEKVVERFKSNYNKDA